ncbi:MAPEG family protein [Mangrovibrevibacter kandeliae]|uniref:MAPEG family protein n=1 Tax=Mangrovibrevibacter kandeliae TaxID=2968473 RepID=UPI0021199830|nr:MULTISPECIES: MAPEG family protein [unclassified Aurantimonas]MCQ8782862.1 MAPEG family protein [Aurantimonas sp. CSK15Z-1]MCW4115933.1 MAPEG family protein [Aurantimonas sp. MSK8Z-1]
MPGNPAIFWPMILQAFLTLAVYAVLFVRRRGAARAGGDFEVMANGGAEPAGCRLASRNLANQYELPVLFYAACLALHATNGASWLAVALAWVFALTRLVHAAIHLTVNHVPARGAAFIVGYVCVGLLWCLLALHLLAPAA